MSTAKAVLLYANWCGHCQAMKEDWEKTKQSLKKEKLPIQILEIEHSQLAEAQQSSDAVVKKVAQDVRGYPTIRFYNVQKGVVDFTGMRTKEELVAFFKSQLGLKQGGGAKKKTTKPKATKPKAKKAKAAPKKGGFLRGNLLIQRANL